MRFESNLNNVNNQINSDMDNRLLLVGQLVRSAAAKAAPKDTGFLRGQGGYELISEKVRVFFNAEYAAIQEFGGDIKPVDAKSLSIPIHKDAKGKSPGEFSDLFLMVVDENAFLVKDLGNDKLRFMYLLVKKVTLPAQPYLRPAVIENEETILRILAGAVN